MVLSICMMVRNEENNLPRCLQSLSELMDNVSSELIVLDTGSTDRTVEIAKKYTDKVFYEEWNDNFSEMRNKSIGYASGEWIFIIDADEELVDCSGIVTFLNGMDNKKFNSAALYLKNFKDSLLTSFSTELVTPRLFKNGMGFRYEGAVHNMPKFIGESLLIESLIYHYGYINDDEKLMEYKYNRTKELLIAELEKEPNNVYYLYQLSTTYAMYGDDIKAYETSLKAFKLVENSETLKSHSYVISAYVKDAYKLKKYDEAICAAELGISVDEEFVDLYYFLASINSIRQNFELAINYYLKYIYLVENFDNLKIKYNAAIQHYTLNLIDEAYCNISIMYISLNNYERCYFFASQIIKNFKNDSIYFQTVYKAYVLSLINLEKFDLLYKELWRNDEFQIVAERILEEYVQNNEDKVVIDKILDMNTRYSHYLGIKFQNNPISLSQKDIEILKVYFANNWYDPFYYLLKYKVNISGEILSIKEEILVNLLLKIDSIHNDFESVIIEYLEAYKFENGIVSHNVKRLFNKFVYIKNIKNDTSFQWFANYVQSGIKFIKAKYQPEYLRILFLNNFLNSEEQFFVLLNDTIENSVIGSLENAVKIFPEYKKEIYEFVDESINHLKANSEVDDLLNRLIDNIDLLIDSNKISEAVDLISKYEAMFGNHKEIMKLKLRISKVDQFIN